MACLPAFVAQLARQHGISYVRTGNDALAEVITRLADDEVLTDHRGHPGGLEAGTGH